MINRIAKDSFGREWARVADVKVGDVLEPNGWFDCMTEGTRLTVRVRTDGTLYLRCNREGGHILDGQVETRSDGKPCEPFYIGLYKVSAT